MNLKNSRGFTVVELLIVIVVIGILAAITIIAFNGVQKKATDAAVKLGLKESEKIIEAFFVTSGTYPVSKSAAGIKDTNLVIYQYNALSSTDYCITATAKDSVFYIKKSAGAIATAGACTDANHTLTGLPNPTNNANVSTLTGLNPGYTDGDATVAQLRNPRGLALSASGDIYVADTGNHRIRKVTTAGVVSTVAGSGTAGYTDGVALSAQFSFPSSVAYDDTTGTLYVGDQRTVRKISSSGTVTTIAGSGAASGTADGAGTIARFNDVRGLGVTSTGVLYVSDSSNNRIRKIAADGTVSTFAGSFGDFVNGTGTAARFNAPTGIKLDSNENIYVADTGNNAIRKITPTAVVTTVAGSGAAGSANGTGTAAEFNAPTDITVFADNSVYVVENEGQKIRKITSTAVVTTFAGSTYGSVNGIGTAAKFTYPYGIVSNSAGNIFISDYGMSLIRKML